LSTDRNNLESILASLNLEERVQLHTMLSEDLGKRTDSHVRIIKEIQDLKHKNGYICPHCREKAIRSGTFQIKDGTERQRYKCKSCNKTFNDLTATPLHRTRDKKLWIRFVKLLIQGKSLRTCAQILEVRHGRLFYWRHKVLAALKQLEVSKFDGIVEVDETYLPYSRKGRRKVENPRKRGGEIHTRGISHEQVCILVARDREKKTFSKAVCRGRIRLNNLEVNLADKVDQTNPLCTDAWRAFSTFAKKHDLEHYRFYSNGKERVKGIYHIQNVNSYHSRWKKWLKRFNGIASKYKDHYLAWFQYLEENGDFVTTENVKNMLVLSCAQTMNETNKSLSQAEFLAA
jgi:transposase-like protein/IS1 family transposase